MPFNFHIYLGNNFNGIFVDITSKLYTLIFQYYAFNSNVRLLTQFPLNYVIGSWSERSEIWISFFNVMH